MGIVERDQILPVLGVEPRHRGENENLLLVSDGVGGNGNIVEIVAIDRRSSGNQGRFGGFPGRGFAGGGSLRIGGGTVGEEVDDKET